MGTYDAEEKRMIRAEALARELADLQDAVGRKQEELYAAIRDVFPENRGGEPKRGLLSALARRIGWTREYVAKIRDSKPGTAASR